MQFDQIINWVEGNPKAVWIGVGVYLALGIFVLWRICRAGTHGIPNITGVARGILTALFALPIWPIVWLVWVLHFRKFAPDAIDLTAYRLPVIDLAEHREDNLRFAPKKLVLEAEIVDSPSAEPQSPREPQMSGTYRSKSRVKTQPVSSLVAAKKKTTESSQGFRSKVDAEAVVDATPSDSPVGNSPAADEKPDSPEKSASSESSGKSEPEAPAKPDTGSAPAPPKLERTKVVPPPPTNGEKPKQPLAPSWKSVAVDPRPPEPPTAPPFVRKLERLSPESEREFSEPAPFPSPSTPQKNSDSKTGNAPENADAEGKTVANPDVPEIPIR